MVESFLKVPFRFPLSIWLKYGLLMPGASLNAS
jgi:hypothetical protein